MTGHVHQISVSKGGVPKGAVHECRVLREGLEGDWQHDRKHHGGPERAVCLFSLEVIERLRGEGHPIGPGTTGENLTISGIAWSRLTPGARVRIGCNPLGVELQIVSYCEPCSTIRNSFSALKFKRIDQDLHPGESRVYARVIREGTVRAGDAFELVDSERAN